MKIQDEKFEDGELEFDLMKYQRTLLLDMRQLSDAVEGADILYLITEDNYDYESLEQIINRIENTYAKEKDRVLLNKIFINGWKLINYAKKNYNFIHWDWHSGNVLVDKNGNVKLFDFDQSEIGGRGTGIPKHHNGMKHTGIKKAFDIITDVTKNDMDAIGHSYSLYRFFMESLLYKYVSDYNLMKYLRMSYDDIENRMKMFYILRTNNKDRFDSYGYFEDLFFRASVLFNKKYD